MGSSTAIRLGCGFFSFVVMARFLGPELFGTVMYWLSVATIVSMVANFGLTPYLLKEIGASPEKSHHMMNRVFSVKLLLSFFIVLVSFGATFYIKNASVFFLLLLALLFDSFTEFLNVGFRATNRFASETKIATVTALINFFSMLILLWITPTAEMAAVAFALSRGISMALTLKAQKSYFQGLRPASLRETLGCIKQTVSYAMDYCLQSLFGQIDSVILNHLAGAASVGVYQAGMRIFMGGAQVAPVLANVFLPEASALATSSDNASFRKKTKLIQAVFITYGAIFGLVMALANNVIVDIVFGKQFNGLKLLLPWLGLLFFIRFFASAWGMILTSAGKQNARTVINGFQWLVCLSCVPFMVSHFGVIGWIVSLSIGQLILGVGYICKSLSVIKPTRAMMSVTVISLLVFIPFLKIS